MLNEIRVSEDFIRRTLERYNPLKGVQLPMGRTARVEPKDIHLDFNRITVHVEHDIPLIPAFDLELTGFEVHGTRLKLTLNHAGILGETPIDLMSHLTSGLIQEALKGQPVTVDGNDITVDLARWLPFPDLILTGLEVSDGITVTFDY
ncbi:MAG TPA: hypothetical protein VGL38_15440 [bacterium]|jgi:hypothetical protein